MNPLNAICSAIRSWGPNTFPGKTPIEIKWNEWQRTASLGGRGASANTMGLYFLGRMSQISTTSIGRHSPLDPYDFGRCLKTIRHFPEWQGRIQELQHLSRAWEGVARCWSQIKPLYSPECEIPEENYATVAKILNDSIDNAIDPHKGSRDREINQSAIQILKDRGKWKRTIRSPSPQYWTEEAGHYALKLKNLKGETDIKTVYEIIEIFKNVNVENFFVLGKGVDWSAPLASKQPSYTYTKTFKMDPNFITDYFKITILVKKESFENLFKTPPEAALKS